MATKFLVAALLASELAMVEAFVTAWGCDQKTQQLDISGWAGTCVCRAGYYDRSVLWGCDPCSRGKSSATVDAQWFWDCTDCDVGHYQDREAQTRCHTCGVGKHQGAKGQQKCEDCSPGWYQDEPGKGYCNECAVGRHQLAEGQQKCDDCSPGRYQDEPGKDSCNICGQGKWSEIYGATSPCTNCDPGTSAGAIEQTKCDPCGEKQWSKAGASTCSPNVEFVDAAYTAVKKWTEIKDKQCIANDNYGTVKHPWLRIVATFSMARSKYDEVYNVFDYYYKYGDNLDWRTPAEGYWKNLTSDRLVWERYGWGRWKGSPPGASWPDIKAWAAKEYNDAKAWREYGYQDTTFFRRWRIGVWFEYNESGRFVNGKNGAENYPDAAKGYAKYKAVELQLDAKNAEFR